MLQKCRNAGSRNERHAPFRFLDVKLNHEGSSFTVNYVKYCYQTTCGGNPENIYKKFHLCSPEAFIDK